MRSCFLFGHANTPRSVLPTLMEAIENEVSKGTKIFYVGYHGSFDRMAITALQKAKQKYSNIIAVLVLPCHPAAYHIAKPDGFDTILYPPLENVPRRCARMRANQYMIRMSERVICYVRHFGNSRNLLRYAQSHGASTTNIAKFRGDPIFQNRNNIDFGK